MDPISIAIRCEVGESLLSSAKIELFTQLFKEQIEPIWERAPEPWLKFSKKAMCIGGSLARYRGFLATVHLFSASLIFFRIKKIPCGSRMNVRLVVLIKKNEEGNYTAELKAEKRLRKECQTLSNVNALMQEYAFLRSLSHDNVFAPSDCVLYRGKFEKISVLEPYASSSLSGYVERLNKEASRKEIGQLFTFFQQIISALEYVNGLGYVHRDVKLENILILDGRAKLIDWEFRHHVQEALTKIEEFSRESKKDIEIFLDEPVYLTEKEKIEPWFFELPLSTYRLAIYEARSASKKSAQIALYLDAFERWLSANIEISGTEGSGVYRGNIPPEARLGWHILEKNDQYGVGTMMEEATACPTIMGCLTLEEREALRSLYRDLSEDDYWKRPSWCVARERLDSLIRKLLG